MFYGSLIHRYIMKAFTKIIKNNLSFLNSFKQGFTLIELLVVIVIIAVLATAIIVAINPAQKVASSRDAKVKGDMNQLISAITAFATEAGGASFPAVNTDLTAASTTVNGVAVGQEIKSYPVPPTGVYTYTAYQAAGGTLACTDVAGNCGAASLYGPNYSAGGTNVWCWRSATNTLTSAANAAACAP